MWVKIISIGICVSYIVASTNGALVTFTKNSDIYDKRNWLNQAPQEECEGLIMADIHGYTTFGKLEIEQLVFGGYDNIFFDDNTDIILDSNTKSTMNCVALNDSEMSVHTWAAPSKWLIEGKEMNMAVPHMERIPCEHDDVVFPKGVLTGEVMIMEEFTIKSLKFGNEYWTNDDIVTMRKDPILQDTILILLGARLNIRNESCTDLSGCVCHESYLSYESLCFDEVQPESYDCFNPILPIGFCFDICGASILFKPRNNFKIATIEAKLKEYSFDTHVSKVKNEDEEDVIQIIFTEKEFSGDCLQEAKSLYDELVKDKTINALDSQYLASSYRYKEGQATKNAVSVVLGSLMAVCLIFGILFFLFADEERTKHFRERLGLGSRPLTYKSMFFSRASISEGTGLIMEGQSVAGSLQNIPKSFENPSFSAINKKSSSTSSSSASSTEDVSKEDKEINKADSKDERTPFQDQETRELIESVAEDGELVDLTDIS